MKTRPTSLSDTLDSVADSLFFDRPIPADTRDLLMRNPPHASSLDAVESVFAGHGPRIVIARSKARRRFNGGVMVACRAGAGALLRWHASSRRSRGGTAMATTPRSAGHRTVARLRALRRAVIRRRQRAVGDVVAANRWPAFRSSAGPGMTTPGRSRSEARRKLLILARASGYPLEADAVQVESLVPDALALLPRAALDDGLAVLDAPLRERYAAAYRNREKLRFVGRLPAAASTVGLNRHPIIRWWVAPADNRVAVGPYRRRPLVIRGPGAGAGHCRRTVGRYGDPDRDAARTDARVGDPEERVIGGR
jgi:homoserine dehydrogenase